MKKYIVVVLILFLSSAIAEDQHKIEAEKLLELSGAKAAMNTMVDMMLTQQLSQNPKLAPFENVMRKEI